MCRQLGLRQPLGNRVHHDLLGIRKPLDVGELFTVIDDVEPEADRVRGPRQVIGHMTRSHEIERRRRLERFDVDLHLTSTDQSGILGDIVCQLVFRDHRLSGSMAVRAFQNASFS